MSYTQSDLRGRINSKIQGKIDMLISPQDTMNSAVREVLTDVSLRSTRRKATLTPNLFSFFYEYQCPSDLKGYAIVDIPAQAKREDGEFTMVPSEQFRRNPHPGDISIEDFNGTRLLLINSQTTDYTSTIVSTDDVDVGSVSWAAFGDATGVDQNTDDYVRGSGSIEFDIDASGGTTAGILISGFNTIDLDDYIGHTASVFVQARITSATNITNYKLRLGQDSSNYYEYTVTARNDGTAFATGWNELRFDVLTPTTTVGSPTATGINYVALYMTKTTGKINENGYMFNGLLAKKGRYHDVMYYSKYGWKTSAGTYIENSTDGSDILIADTDEFDLVVKKGEVIAADELSFPENEIARKEKKYNDALAQYKLNNPSQEKITVSTYWEYS